MTGALTTTSTHIPGFDDLVEAFVKRDFARVASHAEAMAYRDGAVQGLQLALISLCRQGDFAKAHWFAQIASDRIRPQDPESADLISLAIGKVSLDSIMSKELSPVAKCQAAYYAGSAKLSGGNNTIARQLFITCLEIGAPCLEFYLAETELKSLTDKP